MRAGGGWRVCRVRRPRRSCSACPIPASFSMDEAAAIPETYFTVYFNVIERGELQSGETLLIHGGSSGIGTTAIAHGQGVRRAGLRDRRQRSQVRRVHRARRGPRHQLPGERTS